MRTLSALFILLCGLPLYAQPDPFYAEDLSSDRAVQAEETTVKNAKKQPDLTACLAEERHRLTLTTPFEQLKLVGVVELNGQFRALFVNEQQRIVEVRVGDVLLPEVIEMTEIRLKGVSYIDWQKSPSCAEPTQIQLTL